MDPGLVEWVMADGLKKCQLRSQLLQVMFRLKEGRAGGGGEGMEGGSHPGIEGFWSITVWIDLDLGIGVRLRLIKPTSHAMVWDLEVGGICGTSPSLFNSLHLSAGWMGLLCEEFLK